MRLLLCRVCATLEELPDYEGDAAQDVILDDLVRRHNDLDGNVADPPHQRDGTATLLNVPYELWEKNKPAIIRQINEAARKTGFDGWVYDAHNTYAEDALKCYRAHGRPEQGCIDYWSESKRIGRPTPEGRAVIRESYKLGERDPHLCQWCPIHTWVTTERRYKAGMYNDG